MDKKQKAIDSYYDINGLIDQQVILLESISPSLLKKATIDGIEEIQELSSLDSTWEKELVIFKSADINKPLLVDSYNIKKAEDGTSINYTSKFPKSTSVDSLTIFLDEEKNPKRILASLNDRNTLFLSNKKLEMVFKNHLNQHLLDSYTISGWQKMTSKDSTSYLIKAEVIY